MAKRRSYAHIRDRLLVLHAELRSEIYKKVSEMNRLHDDLNPDLNDHALGAVEEDLAVLVTEAETAELQEIEAALQKLESGSYGICDGCDRPIAPARLKALPFATLCVPCKRFAENGTGREYALLSHETLQRVGKLDAYIEDYLEADRKAMVEEEEELTEVVEEGAKKEE